MKRTANILFLAGILLFPVLFFLSAETGPGKKQFKLDEEALKVFSYRAIGPTRQSGRFIEIAVPEGSSHTFYAASASGGLWKTENNGVSFTPLFDREKVFSIGAVAVAKSDPSIVWLGSGEANNSRSSYWGDGVYKSTDSGKTWTNMGLPESHHIGRVVIHPKNPDIVYVAALGKLYSENPERGLYKTVDGGKNWEKVLEVIHRGRHIGVVDVAMDPLDPDIIYAASYDKVRRPWTFNLGGPGSGLYKSVDGGKNWIKLGGGLPGGMLGRIGIAVFERDPNIVYVCVENANKPGISDRQREKELLEGKSSAGMIDGEIYRSDDRGQTWRKVSPDGVSIGGNPGYYYGQIRIDPNDDQRVFVLSVGVLGTEDGGRNWNMRALSGFFGGDVHDLWINPADSKHMIIAFDQGLSITYDRGKNWFHPDHLPLGQFYAVGVDMAYPYNIAGGLQDNGSVMGPSSKRDFGAIRLEDWQRVGGGDGFYNVFDQSNNRFLYNESQFGNIQRIDLLTGDRKNIAYQARRRDLRWNWMSPILISPHNSDVIYHGANILLRSPFRGEYWEEISPDLTSNDRRKLTTGKGGDGNIQYCTITTIDESPLLEGLIWVGTDDGNVQLTRDGGKNWTLLNNRIPGNPGYWVSRVIASAHQAGRAYLAYTGYRNDDFRSFLYRSDDFGQTWRSISKNLPSEPINVIREDHRNQDLLFVGTEFAVYISLDGGESWTRMKNNMPTQPVHDLVIHPREAELVVATHGRSIYIANIAPLQELKPEVLDSDLHLFRIKPKIRYLGAASNVSSSINFAGESEAAGSEIYFYLSRECPEVTITVSRGSEKINEWTMKGKAGINRTLWMMNRKIPRTASERKELEEMLKRWQAMGYSRQVDLDFREEAASEGDYTVTVRSSGLEVSSAATILRDSWFAAERY